MINIVSLLDSALGSVIALSLWTWICMLLYVAIARAAGFNDSTWYEAVTLIIAIIVSIVSAFFLHRYLLDRNRIIPAIVAGVIAGSLSVYGWRLFGMAKQWFSPKKNKENKE